MPIGKASFNDEQLKENLDVLMQAIIKARPAAVKGAYVKSAYISSTMGPSVRLDPLKF